MRRLVLVSAALGVLLAGCGKSDTTVVADSNGNKVSVSKDGTKVSVTDDKGEKSTVETDKDGTTTMKSNNGDSSFESGKDISEAEMGVVYYPGSTAKPASAFRAQTPEAKTSVAIRMTADEPAKVLEFYKGKLKNTTTSSIGSDGNDLQMIKGTSEAGYEVTVAARRDKGQTETEISMTSVLQTKVK